MKTVTIQQARAQFDELLELVINGQAVEVTDHAKTVARIIPAHQSSEETEVDWSDARQRLEGLWNGKLAPGKPASQIIIEDRR